MAASPQGLKSSSSSLTDTDAQCVPYPPAIDTTKSLID
jgi:hypothetical protein